MNTWMDIKILILAVAVTLGYVSHFVFKFPRDSNKVAMCLAGYCVIMALHYYIEKYCEKGAFFIRKSHEFSRFKDWQQISFHSEVEVAKDNLSADYVLTVEA